MDKVKVTLTKFLTPYKCEDMLRIGNNSDGGYLVSLRDLINSNYFNFFWNFVRLAILRGGL